MPLTRRFIVRLQRPQQLFEADDVSPTSVDYTEYTAQPAMDTIRDLLLMRMPRKAEIEVDVVLPAEHVREGLSQELTLAVRRWLKVQNVIDVEATGASGAVGRRLFGFGVAAFMVLQTSSVFLSKLGDDWDNYLVDAVAEGLSVISWVMLWFPIQMFTMEVWRANIRRGRMRVMERMTVRVLWSGDLDAEQAEDSTS